ncbi:LysR family transcriptional regulator [Solirubrobacter deserti]|uniref:LysR family transcriptional regulator n=1 Tax=Solirubrobacter deserti TaxID=2282478 RepID=A0ABT4RRJ8_9ACTN|nr:LysR substrate-binding domain-containing protein [Solirubrobacter deserti]MDA0141151.1 LysR family transcriptional regulator [Solirubrobacter deserti]
MDPRRVLTFRAVAHERSFSAAARALSLTQPAVSQQVAALEKEVGARLLDRENAMALTAAGEVLLAHADAIAERFALASRQLGELTAPGRLRIGAFPSALAALVPQAATRIGQVTLEEGSTPELAERVRRGELHLAVGFQDAAQPRREHDGVERLDLVRESFVAALPPDHPLAAREEISLSALADEPWVAPSGDNLIARACRAAGFEPRLVMISRDPLANRALVTQGMAVTIMPRLLAREFTGVALRPLTDPPQRDLYVLLPPGGRHPLAEDAYRALREVASELS